MAEITIRLRRDPQTGKQEVLIDMESDQDALPHEHEQMHREAVEKIIGKLKRDGIIVDREDETAPALPQKQPPQTEGEGLKESGFRFLLPPLRFGEGGWGGEVLRAPPETQTSPPGPLSATERGRKTKLNTAQ